MTCPADMNLLTRDLPVEVKLIHSEVLPYSKAVGQETLHHRKKENKKSVQ